MAGVSGCVMTDKKGSMMMNVQFRSLAPYASAAQVQYAETALTNGVTFAGRNTEYAGFTSKELKAAAAAYRSQYKTSHLDDAYVFDGRLADSINMRRPAYINPRELALVAVWMLPSKVLGQDHTNMLKGFAQHSDEQIIDITKRAMKAVKQNDPVSAIKTLKEINGVDTTFATVLLSVVQPDKYTPMAGRVLDLIERRSAGTPGLNLPERPQGTSVRDFVKNTPEAYPTYLSAVTHLASKLNVSLADFDRGAWTMAATLPKS